MASGEKKNASQSSGGSSAMEPSVRAKKSVARSKPPVRRKKILLRRFVKPKSTVKARKSSTVQKNAGLLNGSRSREDVCPEITLLSSNCYTLGPCRSVSDIKVRSCHLFPQFLPPEVKVFAEGGLVLEDQFPAPPQVSILFCGEDTRPWDSALTAFAKFGDDKGVRMCIDELIKDEADYVSRKLIGTEDLDVLSVLLTHGANINHRDGHGMTALMHAASDGNADVVNALLNNGADPSLHQDNGIYGEFTALIHAVTRGHVEVVKNLRSGCSARDRHNARKLLLTWPTIATINGSFNDTQIMDLL